MTTATSVYPQYPPYGSPVFTGMEAAAQGLLVHFVGRRRGDGAGQLPQAAANLPTPDRLSNIVWGGLLRAFTVPRSGASQVVCASDISAAELLTAFRTGLNQRGPLEPWALVLDREAMWTAGMRPVVYADAETEWGLRTALSTNKGAGWDGLVVPTEVARGPSRTDWTHEREWRICFPDDAAIPLVRIDGAVRAVIVGETQWSPRQIIEARTEVALTYWPNYQAQRWLWDGATLVHDGVLQITTQVPPMPQP